MFVKTTDREILERLLRAAGVGQMITYDELDAAIGRSVRHHAKGVLSGARKACERDGIIFKAIPNEGYKRLDGTGMVDSAESDRRSVLRKCNRSLNKLAHVKYDELDNTRKLAHTAMATSFSVLRQFATAAAKKKIESRVQNTNGKPLAIGDTLKLFTNGPQDGTRLDATGRDLT